MMRYMRWKRERGKEGIKEKKYDKRQNMIMERRKDKGIMRRKVENMTHKGKEKRI